MQKIKRLPHLIIIIALLFVTGITFYHVFNTGSLFNSPAVLGDEDEDDEDEDENKDDKDDEDNEDNDEDKDENKNDDDKDEVRRTSTSSQKSLEANEDENENEDEDDAKEEIQDLNKDISKVESKINVLGANGVSVDSFRATLAEIKDLASQAGAKMATAPKEAESLIETADHKLERLEKLVKMTLGDEDENDDDNDATEEIQDLAKDIAKIEVKLSAISERGVDVSALRTSLNNIKDLLSQAKEKVIAEDLAGAEALTEVADKKLETLEHAMELAFGDDDEEDGDEAKEYKNEVAQFVHNLKELGDIDEGIGQQVRVVAQAQNDSASKIENSINDINDRSGFVRFLIGPKYGSIAEVQTAITENQTRIKVLTDLMNQITDPAVKLVLQDQITILNQQNTNLQSFVTDSESGFSMFGWLARLFS